MYPMYSLIQKIFYSPSFFNLNNLPQIMYLLKYCVLHQQTNYFNTRVLN